MTDHKWEIEYKTLAAGRYDYLDGLVNSYLRNGWNLYGNPYVHGDIMFQAVVKENLIDSFSEIEEGD